MLGQYFFRLWCGLQSVHVLSLSIHNINNIERKKIIVRPPGRFFYSLHLLNTSECALSVQTPNLLSYYLSESQADVTLYAFLCRQIFLRTLLRCKSSLCFYSKNPLCTDQGFNKAFKCILIFSNYYFYKINFLYLEFSNDYFHPGDHTLFPVCRISFIFNRQNKLL